jgi:hypothetical protein
MDVMHDSTQTDRLANTLRFSTPAGDNERRVTLNGVNFIQTGGILIAPTMDASTVVIGGPGALTTGRVGSISSNVASGTPFDLTVIQNNVGAATEISAAIIDNSAGRADKQGTSVAGSGTITFSPGTIAADLSVGMRVTGPGIAPEMAERLFQPFATHGRAHGSGLGLSICKRIIEDHGGRISARNDHGGGAVFMFSLPLSAANS